MCIRDRLGGTEAAKFDIRESAATFFKEAAKNQGLEDVDSVAGSAARTFGAYADLYGEQLANDPATVISLIHQAGRQAGFTGFPWEPEHLNPAYSAEDIATITAGIEPGLEPMYDIAQGLLNMDYSHIQDEGTRARLEAQSNRLAVNIGQGVGAVLQGPATTAMLTESEAKRKLSADLTGGMGDDQFASILSGLGV